MTDTLDAALEALRRDDFYRAMATAQSALQADAEGWTAYIAERDAWLSSDLTNS